MSQEEPQAKKARDSTSGLISEGCLFAYGNPLLDIIAEADAAFLEKYGLEANSAILADDKTRPIFAEMVEKFSPIDYVPGGATLNAIRVAQWLLPESKKATAFTGCIGKDKFGEIMQLNTLSDNVDTLFMQHDSQPTGTCAVVITGKSRSLVANLAAADHFQKSHLDTPAVWSAVEKANSYYVSSFPLTVSPESVLAIAEHAAATNKTFTMNLSAPFLVQFFKEPMMKVFPYVDILFGNETEAAIFAKEHELGTEDVKEIAKKIANMEKKNTQKKRIVVITQGSENTVVVEGDTVTEYAINPVKPEDIVDTNGAGDAFVGGFLAQLVKNAPLAQCIKSAHYAASVIIQKSGVTLPEKPDLKL